MQPKTAMIMDYLNELLAGFDPMDEWEVNRGGCGLFAYHLGRTLRRMGINAKLLVLHDEYWLLSAYRKQIKEHGGVMWDADKPNHVAVLVGTYVLDSTGAYAPEEFRKTDWGHKRRLVIEVDEFVDAAMTEDGWSSRFQRRGKLRKIKSYIRWACTEAKRRSVSEAEAYAAVGWEERKVGVA